MTTVAHAVVGEIYRAFAEHRFPAELLDEEFLWETSSALPDAGRYRGHAAVREYFRAWTGGWHHVETDVEKLIARGDQVVALICGRYYLHAERVAIEAHYAHVWTVRGGKAVHARALDADERRDLGLG